METLEIYEQMAVKIIAVQEAIMGPLALGQAESVQGIVVDWPNNSVRITGDGKKVIEDLINSYKALFGLSSVEVSKEAVLNLARLLQAEQVPELLSA